MKSKQEKDDEKNVKYVNFLYWLHVDIYFRYSRLNKMYY